MKFPAAVCFALFCSLPLTASAQSSAVVKIHNGINMVDFTGQGEQDLVMSGHRENYNAHSFEVVSFYLPTQGESGQATQWDIVPIMTKDGEKSQVNVSGGADCVLHDFRLLSGHGKEAATLILADRDLGANFASAAKVTFTYYSLVHNVESTPGFPPYAFQQSRVVSAKRTYCDVEESFDRELGLGAR